MPLRLVSIMVMNNRGVMPMGISSISWSLLVSVFTETSWALLISLIAGIALAGGLEHMKLNNCLCLCKAVLFIFNKDCLFD